jgi:hypothetical protein
VPRADKWDGVLATAIALFALALLIASFVIS